MKIDLHMKLKDELQDSLRKRGLHEVIRKWPFPPRKISFQSNYLVTDWHASISILIVRPLGINFSATRN